MGMADIHASQVPGICPHILPWQCTVLRLVKFLERAPRDSKETGGMWLWKMAQNIRGGIWISAVRRCRHEGNISV